MENYSMKRVLGFMLQRLWIPLLIVGIWQLIQINLDNPFFPPPSKIWESVQYVITPEWVRGSLTSSLITLLGGYFIGSTLGVFVGAVLGSNTIAREIFLPITNFIRCIPSVAKAPVILALLGIGLTTRIVTVAVAVFFPVLLITLRGIANTDERLVEYSKVLGFSYWRLLLQVRIPAATGEILTGLQAALQLATLVMVISEMIGSGTGLGAFVIRAQSTFMIADMWFGILLLGVLGVLLQGTFHVIEKRVFPWYFASQAIK
jgi:ABC-type nitrate/sulfonate/bicarbonate transport system permease component